MTAFTSYGLFWLTLVGLLVLPALGPPRDTEGVMALPVRCGASSRPFMFTMRHTWIRHAAGLAVAVGLCLTAAPAAAQWQIETKDGKASAKIGILGQVQGEWIDTAADGEHTSQNLYVRRIRLLLGGKLGEEVPHVLHGHRQPQHRQGQRLRGGQDRGASMYVQDLHLDDYISLRPRSWTTGVDTGMLLLTTPRIPDGAGGHDAAPGIDYFRSGPRCLCAWTYVCGGWAATTACSSAATRSSQHHGVFAPGSSRGSAATKSRNPFRTFGTRRLLPLSGPDRVLLHRAPGRARAAILGIGVFADGQKDYLSYGADVIVEQPLVMSVAERLASSITGCDSMAATS